MWHLAKQEIVSFSLVLGKFALSLALAQQFIVSTHTVMHI